MKNNTKNISEDKLEISLLGTVGVDSGQLYIGDPSHNTKDFGIITDTCYGDGLFNVLLLKDKGEPKEIIIDLQTWKTEED